MLLDNTAHRADPSPGGAIMGRRLLRTTTWTNDPFLASPTRWRPPIPSRPPGRNKRRKTRPDGPGSPSSAASSRKWSVLWRVSSSPSFFYRRRSRTASGSRRRRRGPLRLGRRRVGPTVASLAVRPLSNYSGNPQQDYFVDGMTEALIADLAQLDGLRVISRTSVMQYRAQPKPLPRVAAELGADMIVEGSVVRDGDRVRVTAQLIEADSDHHLWARSYEKRLKDVLSPATRTSRWLTRDWRTCTCLRRGPSRSPRPRQRRHCRLQPARSSSTLRFRRLTPLVPRFISSTNGISSRPRRNSSARSS